jgi:YfiH family protein
LFYKHTEPIIHYKSDILESIPHGFSTKHGGVSTNEYTKSMNLAFGRGDDDDTVRKNFEIFAESIGADPKCGIMLGQVHSANVLTVTDAEFGLGVYNKTELCLDGYVSNTPGALLCVRVADCVPILFADTENRVIGAVHSGWRGSALKIGGKCIEKMTELGAEKENIKVAIGPSICADCYTVRDDFVLECRKLLGDELCSVFIKPGSEPGTYNADLKKLNKTVLLEAGISEKNIDVTDVCTCCNHEDFFSHRYHKNNRGTGCAMIALPSYK